MPANLFGILCKYTQRQNENTLTQAFVALFNYSPVFRHIFIKMLKKRQNINCPVDAEYLCAESQILRKPTAKCKLIADAEIRNKKDNARIATIEVKLSATLSPKQAHGYLMLLKHRKSGATMVVLTKDGVDPELAKHLPKRTIWINWSEIAESLGTATSGNKVERFLRKEFLLMLKEKEIPMLPPVMAKGWSRIKLINKFILKPQEQGLHFEAISAIKQIMDRFVVFRDAAWSELSNKGWKPYNRIYHRDNNQITVDCGYYLWNPTKKVKQRYIALELGFGKLPQIRIYGGWDLREGHPSFDDDLWYKYYHKWTPSKSKAMMCSSLGGPIFDETIYQMRKTLSSFKRSKYYFL